MTSAILLNGADLIADLSGALWWPERRLLAVADLHLEKSTSLAAAGAGLLPPYDSSATLARLEQVIGRLNPVQVLALGDSFHDAAGSLRLAPADRSRLLALTGRHDWLWIAGNHDPTPDPALGGRIADSLTLGPLHFRHDAAPGPHPGEVSGHYHPKAAVRVRGRRITARCFIEDTSRLILPAFGAYTGGLSVRDPAIAGFFPKGGRVHLLGQARVTCLPLSRLCD